MPGETFEPRHTTHGFRYVRVEGHPDDLGAGDLTGIAVHTDMTRTGWFRCSDERINRLHEAAVWSLRGNACDIPTDCPTRERAGWTGDWQIFVPTAAFLYDVAGFSTKWLRDLAAEQWSSGLVANLAPSPPSESEGGFLAALNGSAGWGDAAVIVPWEIYRAYGDVRLLEEQWPSMVAWLSYVEGAAAGARHPERAARRPEPLPHERYLWDSGFHWGEWLVPGEDLKGADEFEAFRQADKADVATAYFAYSARLMSLIAEVIGRGADAIRYAELAERVRAAWQAEFIDPDGRLHPDTQANHVRALAFELVPGRVARGRRSAAGRADPRRRHAARDRLPRHPVPAAGARRHRPRGRRLRAAVRRRDAVVAVHDRPRRDHRVGAVGRDPARTARRSSRSTTTPRERSSRSCTATSPGSACSTALPATGTSGCSHSPAAGSRGRRPSTTARTAGSSPRGGSTATSWSSTRRSRREPPPRSSYPTGPRRP